MHHLSTLLAVADTKPAGGAATGQIIIATTAAVIVTSALLGLGMAHRGGRTNLLRWGAGKASQLTGLPYWAALPVELLGGSLIVAVFGMYWDISLHIDNGRDAGPLANPAHYFILAGLFGIFAAGFLACVLPEPGEKPTPTAVRIAKGWYAPVGGIVLVACSAFSLLGFPLDDMWHRLFGQDVTLWGPTHLMLIGGAGLTLVGYAILLVEGKTEQPSGFVAHGIVGFVARHRHAGIMGGFLIGLSTFQGEFDFGVPQFRLLFHPILIAVAAGIALTAARMYAGRGGALVAAGLFVVVRGGLALIVGPVLGQTMPHFPLFIAEALIVEGVALFISVKRPYAFGAVSGLLIGTVGFAAEYGWSHIFFRVHWPSALIGESLLVVPLVAVAAGLVGAFVGTALAAPRHPGEFKLPRPAPAALAAVAIAGVVAFGLQTAPAKDVSAAVKLSEAGGGAKRQVNAEVNFDPPSAARDTDQRSIIAWQGHGYVLRQLEPIGGGRYRADGPVPAYGAWKTVVRLHKRASLVGVPIYMPEDTAIPAKGVPASPAFTRTFVPEHKLLQRERKEGVAPALPTIAYALVGSIVLLLIAALAWALARVGGREQRDAKPPRGKPAAAVPA